MEFTQAEFVVPENFAMVEPGVYRSSFPRTKNAAFMRHLQLKSVVSLVPEDYPEAMLEFYNSAGIRLLRHGLEGNKWSFKEIDYKDMLATILDILDDANRPLLIHCNKGKHRTGSVIGCLRKFRGWATSSIFTEYLLYAAPKTRLEDQQFIEEFKVTDLLMAMNDVRRKDQLIECQHEQNIEDREKDISTDSSSNGGQKRDLINC